MKRVLLICMFVGSIVVAQQPQQLSLEDALKIGKEQDASNI
jgi:hypothetical protein